MTADAREVQLKATMDASGVRAGVEQAKSALGELGAAGKNAGEQVGSGVKKGTDEAGKGAKQLEQSTKSLIGSIERTTAALKAGEKGTASYFETLAAQRGISGEALKPYLEQLRQAEAAQKAASASLGGMGVSAAQTAAALRQVPAQFTDIATSLASGQAPLTVFLQQGGQLKDAFGGAGAAARALGGYVLGLVNPLTVAAAAVGTLAYGFLAGRAEAQEYAKALIISGNRAGVTADQLGTLAASVAKVGGTQGQAAEVLTEFASAGKVGAENLERFTKAAIGLERAGGPAALETAKAFADLAKEPLQAALKLNEATGFLTVSTYEQVRALELQGKTTEAAKVVQEAYAQAVESRTPELVKQLGYVERAWRGITDAGGKALDAIKGVGRQQTIPQMEEALARLQDPAQKTGLRESTRNRFIDELKQAIETAKESERLQALYATRQAESVRLAEAKSAWDKEADKYLSKAEQRERELNQTRERGQRLVEQGLLSEKDYRNQLLAVREKYEDKSAAKAGNREAARALEQEAALLEKLSGLSGTYYADLQRLDGARKRGVLTEQQYIEAVTELTNKQPFAVALAKQEAEARKIANQAIDEAAKAYDRYLTSLNASANAQAEAVQRLRDEEQAAAIATAGNISLAQALQQVAIARLEDKQRRSQDLGEIDALQREINKRRELIGLIGGQETRKAAEDANKELDKLFDPSRAQSFGDALSGAFAQAANSLGRLSGALSAYSASQEAIAQRQAVINAATDPAKKQREQLKLNEASQRASVSLYADMAGAAKGFFEQGSRGYKTLQAAETAFRAFQLASDLAKGVSAAAVAIATQAQGDPYTAWPRMAAMAAAMAGLGFVVSGGLASGPSGGGDGAKVATGTGTVLGDAQAKSESLARATERLADTARLQLTTQSGMLASLRNIENSIGGITGLVLRGQAANGSAAEQFGIQTGTKVNAGSSGAAMLIGLGQIGGAVYAIDKLLFGGKITSALFGKKTTITGNGLFAGAQGLGSIVSGGLNLQDYVDVNQKSKFFGITTSNKNSTQYQAADAQLQQQFGQVFKDIYSAILQASDPLGLALGSVKAKLEAFVVDIGKIDLKGLTGEQITEKLSAVLGAAADDIAAAAIPGLQAFQNVGEGYFETVIRVAAGIEQAGAALELLGIDAINFADIQKKQGNVAAEIVRQSIAAYEALDGTISSVGALVNTLDGSAEDLIDAYRALVDVRDILISVGESGDSLTAAMIRGAGGLDALQSSLAGYLEDFFSETERTAAGRARLQDQFTRLGLGTLPETRAAFRALVEGVDTSTEAGQKLYAQLVGLSGAFADLVPAVASVADTTAETLRRLTQTYADNRAQLEIELLRTNGDEAGARARERALQLARDTVGLSATDAAAVAALYDYNRALRDQIDTARAAAEAQRAIEAAQKRATETLASARFDLENQLLGLQGNSEEVARRTRERDLAQLTAGLTAADAAKITAAYDANAALRAQIDATNAAQEAARALAEAQSQAAADAESAAAQFRAAWQSITDTLFDEVARIRGLLGGSNAQSLAQAQARFSITTAQARAGDQEAAKLLPALSQTLLQLAEVNAASLIDLQRIRAAVAASLEQTGTGLAGRFGLQVPQFAVGTNYVPQDMLAVVHEGEAIVPRAYNPAAAGSSADNAALVAEVRGLREENKAQALAIVRMQTDLNRVFKRWDTEGLPKERIEA